MDAKIIANMIRNLPYNYPIEKTALSHNRNDIADFIEQQEKELWQYKEVERVRNIVENDFSLPDWEAIQEQQKKYVELGRLFSEALKVQTTDKRLTTIVCKELPPEVTKHYCGENCEWESVCKVRAELLAEGCE